MLQASGNSGGIPRRVAQGQPFRDTLIALDSEQRNRDLRTLLWVVLLASGTLLGWAFFGEVEVYAVSKQARIEADRVHPVVATTSGRLVWARLELGRRVEAGELLAQLDDEVEKQELEEARRRSAAIGPRIEALRAELEREGELLEAQAGAARHAIAAARSRREEALTVSRVARDEADRISGLALGVISELERVRARGEARRRRAAASASRAEVRLVKDEMEVERSATEARVARLQRELAELEGALSTAGAQVEVAKQRLARRRIHATQSGVLVGTSGTRLGDAVHEGQQLGTVLAGDRLHIVAEFAPSDAVGRVRAGQSATMWMAGFPWAQFGTLRGRVSHVASEAKNGAIRVELALVGPEHSPIPLQHGLEGTLEVSVDRTAPIQLFAQMLGAAFMPGASR